MLLKRLELQGLKSFADKTVLDLNHNITAIVGPNGSGKSNITDGIRWLLGERDARNLRGAKGEDLIFAGTEKRPRMGQAQATLYFDNSSGFFPVDFKEVSISRKVSRDGISQFFINNSEVRLKDVIDFLARVRLGARGLTVVNQGQSDIFIAASPTDRREMIEEMLGLREYQLKKADAERKLKNTSFNLEKVRAIIEELKPHLRLLRRQSTRYESREKISEELFALEDAVYGARLARLKNESIRLEKEEKGVNEKINKEEPEFKKIEEQFEKVGKSEPEATERLKSIQKEKQEIHSKKSELGRELGRLEARLEFQSAESLNDSVDIKSALREIKNITKELLEENDIETLRGKAKRVLEIIDGMFKRSEEENDKPSIKEAHKKLSEDLKEFELKLEKLNKEEGEYQKTLEGFNKTFRDAYEKVESARKLHEELTSSKNKVALERERVDLRLEALKEELGQIGRSITSLEASIAKNNISGDHLVDEDTAMGKMFRLRQEIASIGEIDETIIKEAKETEERHEFLSKQVEDLEKAISDLTLLIKELEEKITTEFNSAMKAINEEFGKLIGVMFGGGKAKLVAKNMKQRGGKTEEAGEEGETEIEVRKTSEDFEEETQEEERNVLGVDIEISLPKKKVKGLDVLSGGERSLVSIAVLFALISVSPPPFLVLDEIDAALDEKNAKRFGDALADFAKETQFVIVTHNRATMEAAQALYGVTMSADGTSKLVSLKLSS